LTMVLVDIDVPFGGETFEIALPGATIDKKLDGSLETITISKIRRGQTKEFSTFTESTNIHESIGAFKITNIDDELAGNSFPFEFVLSSSNGEETTLSLNINLKKAKPP